jgi:hypothetical protein
VFYKWGGQRCSLIFYSCFGAIRNSQRAEKSCNSEKGRLLQFSVPEAARENEREYLQTLQMPLWRSYGLASCLSKKSFSLCLEATVLLIPFAVVVPKWNARISIFV